MADQDRERIDLCLRCLKRSDGFQASEGGYFPSKDGAAAAYVWVARQVFYRVIKWQVIYSYRRQLVGGIFQVVNFNVLPGVRSVYLLNQSLVVGCVVKDLNYRHRPVVRFDIRAGRNVMSFRFVNSSFVRAFLILRAREGMVASFIATAASEGVILLNEDPIFRWFFV